MAMRKISLVVNEFYHIYNRGVEKRVIFIDKYDYQRFVELLFLVNTHHAIDLRSIHDEIGSVYDFDRGEPLLAIGAYCLMPNHFHLLVTPIAEDGVSLFMSKLCTSYSMYFNKKYQRNGTLFQGRYKAEWADSDQYLKYLFAYIHLNPVKLIDSTWKEEGIKDAAKAYAFAASFQYSSLSDYLSLRLKTRDVLSMRSEAKILNSTKFPNYFQILAQQEKELQEWLTYKVRAM